MIIQSSTFRRFHQSNPLHKDSHQRTAIDVTRTVETRLLLAEAAKHYTKHDSNVEDNISPKRVLEKKASEMREAKTNDKREDKTADLSSPTTTTVPVPAGVSSSTKGKSIVPGNKKKVPSSGSIANTPSGSSTASRSGKVSKSATSSNKGGERRK